MTREELAGVLGESTNPDFLCDMSTSYKETDLEKTTDRNTDIS